MNTPTPDEQAWLDAAPEGTCRTITKRVGEMSTDFTVDRRESLNAAALSAKLQRSVRVLIGERIFPPVVSLTSTTFNIPSMSPDAVE